MMIIDVNNNILEPGDICLVVSEGMLTLQKVKHYANSTVVFESAYNVVPEHNITSFSSRQVNHKLCKEKVFNLSKMQVPFKSINVKN